MLALYKCQTGLCAVLDLRIKAITEKKKLGKRCRRESGDGCRPSFSSALKLGRKEKFVKLALRVLLVFPGKVGLNTVFTVQSVSLELSKLKNLTQNQQLT